MPAILEGDVEARLVTFHLKVNINAGETIRLLKVTSYSADNLVIRRNIPGFNGVDILNKTMEYYNVKLKKGRLNVTRTDLTTDTC